MRATARSSVLRLHFVLGAGISSRLIAWWGNGYGGYSHVDAILADGTLLGARSDWTKDANGHPIAPGVRIRPPNYEVWKEELTMVKPVSPLVASLWEKSLRSQEGKGYDKADILGLILGKPITETGHWICSACQTNSLQAEGVEQLPQQLSIPDQQVTPNTLLAMVEVAGFKKAA